MRFTIKLYLSILLFSICVNSIYITLKQPSSIQQPISRKCLISSVKRQQKLLIQINLPILAPHLQTGMQIYLKYNQNKNLLLKQIIKTAKFQYTVNKETNNVQQASSSQPLLYETCVYIQNKKKLSTSDNTLSAIQQGIFVLPKDNQQKVTNNQGFIEKYLIQIKLLTNFSHIISSKKQPQSLSPSVHHYTKQNLQQLKKISQRLFLIAKQQIQIHQQNQKIEIQTQKNLKNLQDSIYSSSILQSALLVFGSLMHVNLMRSYLKGNKLV